ncbi:SRPBCC family protein [Agrococcus jejuensis]|uniref:Uncharacterized conserved protein YndB, AHSA1/START domain n=1 Tax=Agrococcus jejuensis TaxID=399736 RepID=A0A1G8EAM4_9MICO|nr:SRPBCC domain-containing protein [Agrococcus jejuensis]SDH66953.1 Uncharacterized conserved protein YndB, AHSA1/START domain [Agrococcus jejuensis]
MTDRQFTITRTFDAPRALVWRAWTDPTIAAHWWHPHDVTTDPASVHVDLRVGGRYGYVMTGPDGTEYPTGGTYLEVREPERLRCSWGFPDDPVDAAPILTIDLVETADGRTEMTFHVAGVDARVGADDSVHDGWSQAFEHLDVALAGAR